MTVGEIIEEPLEVFGVKDRAERSQRAGEILEIVGLRKNVMNRFPHEFSGGQRRRIELQGRWF